MPERPELDAAEFLLATRIQREATLRTVASDDEHDRVRAAEFLLATRSQLEASERAVKNARAQEPE